MVCEHDYHSAPMNCEKERRFSLRIEAISEVVFGGRLNFFFVRTGGKCSESCIALFFLSPGDVDLFQIVIGIAVVAYHLSDRENRHFRADHRRQDVIDGVDVILDNAAQFADFVVCDSNQTACHQNSIGKRHDRFNMNAIVKQNFEKTSQNRMVGIVHIPQFVL